MRCIRLGIFETNSSSTHSLVVYIGDYSYSEPLYDDESTEDEIINLSDEVDEILKCIPVEKLIGELRRRLNEEDKDEYI